MSTARVRLFGPSPALDVEAHSVTLYVEARGPFEVPVLHVDVRRALAWTPAEAWGDAR